MRLKAKLQNQAAKRLFSPKRRDAKRRKAETARQSSGRPHQVEYFHEAGDPYSHLMLRLLPEFTKRYDIDLKIHVVASPPDWAAPDRARLQTYSRFDAERLAGRIGTDFKDHGQQPDPAQIDRANSAFLAAVDAGIFLEKAPAISDALWSGQAIDPVKVASVQARIEAASARRNALGHYLGATLYYEGEWYWGPDRLHHLEMRLRELGAAREAKHPEVLFAPPEVRAGPSAAAETGIELHWYLSFRSPYTGIVANRVKALADAYGADLKLRFVLPMVMRGMQVPRMKGFYIMSDTVREAERQSIPFGNAVDPVGTPVERGYAILDEAIKRGAGFEFAQSFLKGVWADGLDAGTDRGLKIITERAGLAWSEMKPLIGSEDWRPVADANRQEMFKYDIWGVPSFRVGDVAAWGQDRLWVIEDALKTQSELGERNAGD
jgi:2-hydroxychromene-2-carboxylate isomerase